MICAIVWIAFPASGDVSSITASVLHSCGGGLVVGGFAPGKSGKLTTAGC